jgi:RNA polymerase sigma factor (TIGR02999 family)
MTATDHEITELLHDWGDGDREALERLMPLVFDELRRIANGYFIREGRGHTLQPTALVNEVYLRLLGRRTVQWQNRAHFFGFAAELMRRILVDHARSHQTAKRGQGAAKISLEEGLAAPKEKEVDLVVLDDALKALAEVDPRQSRIVELRFFAGLTNDEIAEVLDVSPTTVKREWRTAKLWLLREIKRD